MMASDHSAPLGVPQVPDLDHPAVVKVTRGHSCVLCQQRKVRCDKNKPCANCVKAQVECRVVPPQPPRRRKKKLSERELVERVRRYEALLSENGIDFDPSGIQSFGAPDDVTELESDLSALKTSPSSGDIEFSAHEELIQDSSDGEDYEGSSIHQAYDKMFDNADAFPFHVGGHPEKVTELHPTAVQIFQLWQIYLTNVNPLLKVTHMPTLQDQIVEAATNITKIPKGLEALIFGIYLMATLSMSEEECLNTFSESKKALLGKFHRGSQQALVNAEFMRTNDLSVLQAFLLYLLGIRRYIDPRSLFCFIGIAIRIAYRLGLHRDGAQFGLPPFEVEMRRRLWWQLVVLDKRIGEMTGSTITALTSGGDTKIPLNINDADLHVDSEDPPTPHVGPTEMMFALTRLELVKVIRPDSQVAALKGSGTIAGAQAPLPPNITVSTPAPLPANQSPAAPGATKLTGPGCVPVDLTANLKSQRPSSNLDVFCQYMEDTYLRHCDAKVPLHLFTILMTRQGLWKMRVIHYMCLEAEAKCVAAHVAASTPATPKPGSANGSATATNTETDIPPTNGNTTNNPTPELQPPHPSLETGPSTPTPQIPPIIPLTTTLPNRDIPLLTAIHTLEADNTLHTSTSLKGFHWCTLMHLPFPSYMFLVHELRRVTTGDLCARAWSAIAENHEKRKSVLMSGRNPMHIAMGHLFVKAWDARVGAAGAEARARATAAGAGDGGRDVGAEAEEKLERECPMFIRRLRKQVHPAVVARGGQSIGSGGDWGPAVGAGAMGKVAGEQYNNSYGSASGTETPIRGQQQHARNQLSRAGMYSPGISSLSIPESPAVTTTPGSTPGGDVSMEGYYANIPPQSQHPHQPQHQHQPYPQQQRQHPQQRHHHHQQHQQQHPSYDPTTGLPATPGSHQGFMTNPTGAGAGNVANSLDFAVSAAGFGDMMDWSFMGMMGHEFGNGSGGGGGTGRGGGGAGAGGLGGGWMG